MSQLSLTEGNVRRALSRFAIPFLGASLLQFLYGAVDLIVVGQFADQAGIAAVSTGSQVMQAVTNFIIGLSTGGTVLVGQYLGARRGEDVNRAIGTLFSLFALIAELGVKNGAVLWPLRVALTGKSFTPGGGVEMAVILGKEESLARIRKGIAQLQG